MQRRYLLIAAGAALLLILVIVAIALLSKGGGQKDKTVNGPAALPTQPPAATATAAAQDEAAESVTAAPTAAPTPTPAPTAAAQAQAEGELAAARALTRPTATAEGFMPIFMKANTQEKIVAITVDDCFQANNLQQIVDAALAVNGKLTIFPIGENALKEKQSQILKYAWENGFELENHTFTHNGLYKCSEEELMEEIYKQQLALSYILGVEYQCHFLRPRGGDARRDQRIQKAAEQMGYYGIAHWSASGSNEDEVLAKKLEPGAIYLFHTTDKDLDKLLRFIPWVASKGYQLVTLNEMFGYPENETSPLTTPISEHVIPTLAPFERVLVPYKKTSYSNGVLILQQKLIELGYLTGEPDGVYGSDCENAIKKYQQDHGLEVTGIADVAVQEMILGE